MPQIRVLLGFQQGHVFSLIERPMVIGRDPKADIVLHPDSAASRRHAEIYPVTGGWRIRDLGSVNGTELNGQKLRDENLNDKDEVVVGDNVFVFENKGLEAAAIAEAASRAIPSESRGLTNRPEIQKLVMEMGERTKAIEREIGKVIGGQNEIIRDVLTTLLSGGHLLLSGMPGLAKAKLVRTIAEVLDLQFKRIQGSQDLLPSDVTGSNFFEVDGSTGKKEHRFVKGPLFSQVLLADEINRTPPKTQAALMEAMQERRITVGDQTIETENPFFVLGTQALPEHGGTATLAETYLDRFMFSVHVDYPTEREEEMMAKAMTVGQIEAVPKVLRARQILELQAAVRDLPISDHVVKYAVRLIRSTRPADQRAPDFVKKFVRSGAGPQAAHYLILGAKARAVIDGRLLVTPDDIRSVGRATLRHRVFTNVSAASEGFNPDVVVKKILATIPEPGEKNY